MRAHPTSHITSEELAAYLDDRLDARSSATVESHMADCASCRGDLVDARRLLEPTTHSVAPTHIGHTPRARVWLIAAGLLLIAFLPLRHRLVPPGDIAPAIRAARPARASIEIVSPGAKPIDAEAVTFIWRPLDGATTYRLTVTDSSGKPLFTTATADTVVPSTAGAAMRRASSYLWYVDGLTSDGRTVSSGIRSFSTTR